MLSIDTLQSFESGNIMKDEKRILKNCETLQYIQIARPVQNTSSAENYLRKNTIIDLPFWTKKGNNVYHIDKHMSEE